MSQTTVMAEAFSRAGYEPPQARLTAIAVTAWTKYPGFSATGARMDYMRQQLRHELTWAMLEEFRPRALTESIEALLRKAEDLIRAERDKDRSGVRTGPKDGRGHAGFGNHCKNAPSIHPIPSAEMADGQSRSGHNCSETHNSSARPAPNLKAMADRQQAAMAARASTVVRMSKLDEITLNGRQLGDLTSREALAWAATFGIKVRFVEMVTANLPLDLPIRECTDPDYVDELYRRAEAQS